MKFFYNKAIGGGRGKLKLSEVKLHRKLKKDNGQQHNVLKDNANIRYLPSAAGGLASDNFC